MNTPRLGSWQRVQIERTPFAGNLVASKRRQCNSATKLGLKWSKTKRKSGTLDGLADDPPQPMTEAAAALLLRHKRRNRPGHTHGAAPRRRGRRNHHTHHTHPGRLVKEQLREADHNSYEVYAKYYHMHVCTYTNTGSPGLANPAVSWTVGIGFTRAHLDAVGSYSLAQSHIPRPCLMNTMYILEYIFT